MTVLYGSKQKESMRLNTCQPLKLAKLEALLCLGHTWSSDLLFKYF